MSRAKKLGLVFSLLTVASLGVSTPTQAYPENDILTLYYDGCPRQTPAVGWHHQSCTGSTYSGQQSGHWKELEIHHCWTLEESAEYYEYRNGNWVQVTPEYFFAGECSS